MGGLALILWLASFFASLAGGIVCLFIVIQHDDARCKMIKPNELCEALNRFMRIEYLISILICLVCQVQGAHVVIRALSVPLVMYNCAKFKAKEHQHYFISLSEYKKDFSRIEFQY